MIILSVLLSIICSRFPQTNTSLKYKLVDTGFSRAHPSLKPVHCYLTASRGRWLASQLCPSAQLQGVSEPAVRGFPILAMILSTTSLLFKTARNVNALVVPPGSQCPNVSMDIKVKSSQIPP